MDSEKKAIFDMSMDEALALTINNIAGAIYKINEVMELMSEHQIYALLPDTTNFGQEELLSLNAEFKNDEQRVAVSKALTKSKESQEEFKAAKKQIETSFDAMEMHLKEQKAELRSQAKTAKEAAKTGSEEAEISRDLKEFGGEKKSTQEESLDDMEAEGHHEMATDMVDSGMR